jgi:hypothetical protein
MITNLYPPTAVHHDLPETLTLTQKRALRRSVAKVVALGARVDVSPDQMIQMLQAGVSVAELLEYLASKTGEIV